MIELTEEPRPPTDFEAACDGCGLVRRVRWFGPDDVPDDVAPGGYCTDCANTHDLPDR